MKMKKYGIRLIIDRNGIQKYETAHLQRTVNSGSNLWFFCNKSLLEFQHIKSDEFEEFCKRHKGVGVEIQDELVIIYNDPYCTVPIYVAVEEGHIIITSDFEEFYGKGHRIDEIGFYEILLYNSGVYDRTLIDGIKQMPAAAKCVIDCKQTTYKIVPYWNFEIVENHKYEDINLAVSDVDKRLHEVFLELEQPICMGLSGGLDSRLSACMLHSIYEVKDILFYTFGYSPKILEYKLAQETVSKLWNNSEKPQHEFLQLTAEDYLDSEYVPVSTGAQISPDHIHMYRCVHRIKNNCKTFISNYYSDAVMGWDALPFKSGESIEDSDYYKKLYKNQLRLTDKMIQEIKEDLRKVCCRYPQKGNFTCMNEFVYVTERNPKFHVRLSAMVGEFTEIELPYADFELLNIMLSIPPHNRAEKLIEQKLIQFYLGELRDISSRRYSERSNNTERRYGIREKIFYQYGYFRMRAINAFNALLARVTGYKYQVVNPYLTENQNFILNNYLFEQFSEALEFIKRKNLINEVLAHDIEEKEYRSLNAGIKFTIIGLWKSMLEMENNE